MPGGSIGGNSWEGFFSAGMQINQVISEHIQGLLDDYGIAGFRQGRRNDQILFADKNNHILESAPNQLARSTDRITLINVSADEFSVDGHASSSFDSHALQSEIDSFLRRTEESAIMEVASNPESWDAKNGIVIDTVASVYRTLMSAVSRRPRAATGPVPIVRSSSRKLSRLAASHISRPSPGKRGSLVGSDILAPLATPGEDQSENQHNQGALQCSVCFGSLTALLDG